MGWGPWEDPQATHYSPQLVSDKTSELQKLSIYQTLLSLLEQAILGTPENVTDFLKLFNA